MYDYKSVLKRSSCDFCLILLVICVLCLGCQTSNILGRGHYGETVETITKKIPLLLNSGIVESNEAEASIILWFEEGDIPMEIVKKRPMADWVWTTKTLRTENGKVAKTMFGRHFVNKNEENILFTWYTTMAQELVKAGGKIYFDERVPQTIDVSAYLSKINAFPSQSFYLGNMVSIAAYDYDLNNGVRAGKDRINIQLLSRGKNTEGQSVLAMPALLEEF